MDFWRLEGIEGCWVRVERNLGFGMNEFLVSRRGRVGGWGCWIGE